MNTYSIFDLLLNSALHDSLHCTTLVYHDTGVLNLGLCQTSTDHISFYIRNSLHQALQIVHCDTVGFPCKMSQLQIFVLFRHIH